MIYLAAAYGVFWLVTFVLVFSIFQRQRRLQQQVATLRRALEERQESSKGA